LFRIPDPKGGSQPSGFSFSRVGPLGLLLFLGVVVVGFFVLEGARKTPVAGRGEAPVEGDRFVREPKIEFLDEGDLAAQYPTTVRDELQKELFDWWQTPGRQGLSDQRDDLESEWVRHLLSDAARPRLERLPGWVFGELQPLDRVVAEPGSHRGRLVQVWGSVTAVEPVRLPTEPERPGWRVRIDDPQGHSWTVVTAREPPEEAKTGRWVKAFGVFVKLCPGEEGRPSFLLFSAQRLVPSYPPITVKRISPEWAAEVDDSTLEASQTKPGEDGDAFWLLMNYVRSLGPEGYAKAVASGELKVTDMTGPRGATDLAQNPALHRFELVRLRVGIARGEGAFVTEPDLVENAGNIRQVIRGFVIDDQQRVIWTLTPLDTEQFRIGDARLAFVEGFFYKRMAVEKARQEGEGETGLYWMPVIVATAIHPIDTTKSPSSALEQAKWIVLIGAVVCAVLYVVVVFRNRRQHEEIRRRQEERIAKRRNGAGETAAPPVPGAGPPTP
jgi:hypothetical protein